MHRIFSIIITLLLFSIILLTWLWYRSPRHLLDWWNIRIKNECDQQDSTCLNGIPSYQDAWMSSNKTIVDFHRLVTLYHDDILAEVNDIITTKNPTVTTDLSPQLYNQEVLGKFNPGFLHQSGSSGSWGFTTISNDPSVILSSDHHYNNEIIELSSWFKDESKWSPIWVRSIGEWTNSADVLPTLKKLAFMFPEILSLYVSIFYPGMTLIEHKGISRSLQRYHYGLQVPMNDVGFRLAGYDIKWKEKEGFVWDDTLPHSAWNYTSQPRIIIFADIFRNFSPINSYGSKLIYSLIKRRLRYKEAPQTKTLNPTSTPACPVWAPHTQTLDRS